MDRQQMKRKRCSSSPEDNSHGGKRSSQQCSQCRAHGKESIMKDNHNRNCPYKECKCSRECLLTHLHKKTNAMMQKTRRAPLKSVAESDSSKNSELLLLIELLPETLLSDLFTAALNSSNKDEQIALKKISKGIKSLIEKFSSNTESNEEATDLMEHQNPVNNTVEVVETNGAHESNDYQPQVNKSFDEQSLEVGSQKSVSESNDSGIDSSPSIYYDDEVNNLVDNNPEMQKSDCSEQIDKFISENNYDTLTDLKEIVPKYFESETETIIISNSLLDHDYNKSENHNFNAEQRFECNEENDFDGADSILNDLCGKINSGTYCDESSQKLRDDFLLREHSDDVEKLRTLREMNQEYNSEQDSEDQFSLPFDHYFGDWMNFHK